MGNNNINNDNEKIQEGLNQEVLEDDGSRTNRRSKTEKRTWFVVSIIVILFLIVLIPTGAILYSQMNGKLNSGKTAATITIESSTKASSSTKETESSSVESSSSTIETSTSTTQSTSTSESFADVEVPKNDPSTRGQVAQNEIEDNQSQTNMQNQGGVTVAYGQGDSSRSLWKIAQEAGISLDQLYQLNPGIDPSNIQPGQPIRVQ